jgi:hypothetical protein
MTEPKAFSDKQLAEYVRASLGLSGRRRQIYVAKAGAKLILSAAPLDELLEAAQEAAT